MEGLWLFSGTCSLHGQCTVSLTRRVMHSAVTARSAHRTPHWTSISSIKIYFPYGLTVLPKRQEPALAISMPDVSSVHMPGKTQLVEPLLADQLDRAATIPTQLHSVVRLFFIFLRMRSDQTYCTATSSYLSRRQSISSELFAAVKTRKLSTVDDVTLDRSSMDICVL
jgi:hypothetical protein